MRFELCLLLTREACRRAPLEVVRAAVEGGVDVVQMREKHMSLREQWSWGRELHTECERLGVPLIVNDSVELGLALDAEGVHLGQDDLHPTDARALLGSRRWIGWSTHDLEQLDEAAEIEVDYAGFGPVFATETKGYVHGLGPQSLAAALAIARLPVLAIGGLSTDNTWMIPTRCGIATSSAICAAEDPAAAARTLLNRIPPSQR